MAAVFSGWVFVVREGAGGECEVLPQLMALAHDSLLLYRHDPQAHPAEEPTFSGKVAHGSTVEVQGRKVLPNGQVLHLFTVSSGSLSSQNSAKKVQIGCTAAEAAHRWVSALEAAAADSPEHGNEVASGAPLSAQASDAVPRFEPLAKVVSIGGSETMHPRVGLSSEEEEEDDSLETVQWRLIRLFNGLRIFEGHSDGDDESSDIRLIKAEGVVEAEPDQIFEVVMNLHPASRTQWDMVTADAVVVEVIDGFTDKVHASYAAPAKGGKQKLRNVMSTRTWRRNGDGSYVISYLPDEAAMRSSDKSGRFESAVFTWDIVPVCGTHSGPPFSSSQLAAYTPSTSGYYPRSLVKFILEMRRPGGGTKTKHHISLPFLKAWDDKDKEKEKKRKEEKEREKAAHPGTPRERDVSASARPSSMSWGGPATAVPQDSFVEQGLLEELADGVVFSSLIRIAGLREYFATRPPPRAALEAGAEAGMGHDSRALSQILEGSMKGGAQVVVGGDEFFDAIESTVTAEVDQQKHEAARKRWQRIKWLLRFGLLIHSLKENADVAGLSWNIPRELLHNCPPVDMDALEPLLRSAANVPKLTQVDPNAINGYKDLGGANFMLRGPNYLKDRVKVPAGEPLLRLVGMDWFASPQRIDNIAARPGCLVQSEKGKSLPFIFVINLQVPGNPHYSLVAYFAADRPIRGHPKSLLHRFYSSTDDNFRNSRFKLIPRISEGDWMVKRAVGTKAAILGKALKCTYHKGRNYLEMDCDIGSSSVARNVIGLVISYITSLVIDLVFLIEAQEAEELPEYLLGAFTVVRLDTKKAMPPPPEATDVPAPSGEAAAQVAAA